MRDAEFAIDVQQYDLSDERKARDAEFFATVIRYGAEIKAGRLRICRAQPGSVLKLFEDDFFDVAFLNGRRAQQRAKVMLEWLTSKTKPGGMLITNAYDDIGLSDGMHRYLGDDKGAGTRRISALNKPYLAIEV